MNSVAAHRYAMRGLHDRDFLEGVAPTQVLVLKIAGVVARGGHGGPPLQVGEPASQPALLLAAVAIRTRYHRTKAALVLC